MNPHALLVLCSITILGLSNPALGQPFAEPPPDRPVLAQDDSEPLPHDAPGGDGAEPFGPPRSTLRLSVGPALRVSEHSPDGGLFAAIDIGERAAGLRLSGAWVRVGARDGLQQYSGELFIDFGEGRRLHPILGAGAGIARIDGVDASGESSAHTLGVGLLRGGLQYGLPVRSADARAGLELIGNVPAIRGDDAAPTRPWLLAVATVGIGF